MLDYLHGEDWPYRLDWFMDDYGYGYTEYEIEEKIRVYPDDEYRVRHRRWR